MTSHITTQPNTLRSTKTPARDTHALKSKARYNTAPSPTLIFSLSKLSKNLRGRQKESLPNNRIELLTFAYHIRVEPVLVRRSNQLS